MLYGIRIRIFRILFGFLEFLGFFGMFWDFCVIFLGLLRGSRFSKWVPLFKRVRVFQEGPGFTRGEGLDTSKISYEVSRQTGGQILRILRILEDSWGFPRIPRDSRGFAGTLRDS